MSAEKDSADSTKDSSAKTERRRQGSFGWFSGKGFAIALLAGWVACLAAFGIWGAVDDRKFDDETTQALTACRARPPAEGEERATLDMRPNSRGSVVFGRDTGLRHAEIDFQMRDPSSLLQDGTCLELVVGSFVRDTNDAELDRTKIHAQARVKGDRALVAVTFDRKGSSFGPGGSYSGFVSIVDPRVERVDIPIGVTLSYPVWQWPLAVTVFMLLPAFVFVVAKLSAQNPTLSGMQTYLSNGEGFAALAAGIVASLGVYMSVYLQSGTWDAEVLQYFALMAAVVAAFVAVATLPGKAPTSEAPAPE